MKPIQRLLQCVLLLAALSSFADAYYAPDQGRWLNRDPLEENGGVNLYAYVENDSVNKLDKLGLSVTFLPQTAQSITPEWRFFYGRATNWRGVTVPSHAENCDCSCKDSLWQIKCEVKTTYKIFLNSRLDIPRRHPIHQIYGHEQAHVRSRNYRAEVAIKQFESTTGFGPFPDKYYCNELAGQLESQLKDMIDAAWKDDDHDHNDHSPSDGEPIDQEEGTPNVPAHPGGGADDAPSYR